MAAMDVSLDEVIKAQKPRGGRGRGRGRGRGGRGRRGGGRGSQRRGVKSRETPRDRMKAKHIKQRDMNAKKWRNDRFERRQPNQRQQPVPKKSILTGTEMHVSNLDAEVTSADVEEIFSQVGKLKKALVHHDENGQSLGTAIVVFVRQAEAMKAFKDYNNVKVDGKPMKLTLSLAAVPEEKPNHNPNNNSANSRGGRGSRPQRGGRRGGRGGGRGGRGGGRGGRGGGAKPFANPLQRVIPKGQRKVNNDDDDDEDVQMDSAQTGSSRGSRGLFGSALRAAVSSRGKSKEKDELDADMEEWNKMRD